MIEAKIGLRSQRNCCLVALPDGEGLILTTYPEVRLQLAAVTLAEELNFTRAADRIKISQPAVEPIRIPSERIYFSLDQAFQVLIWGAISGLIRKRIFEANHPDESLIGGAMKATKGTPRSRAKPVAR